MPALDRNALLDILQQQEYIRYINVFTNLNMELVQSTIAGAETGNLGDLYQLYEYLEASDARLKGMLNNRRKAVTKNIYNVSSADLDVQQANDVAQFVHDQITMLDWRAYLSELMDGRIYGVMIHQKKWYKRLDGKMCIKDMYPVDKAKYGQENNTYKYDIDVFGKLYVSKYSYGTEKAYIDQLLNERLITVALDKDFASKYDMQGIMRGVARWYLIKLFAIQNWSKYAEKYGHPIVTAKVPLDQYKESSSLMRQLLSSVGSNRYGILLDGMEVDVVNGASNSNIDAFDRLIQLCNTEMAIAILGQNLTTDVSGGSYSASKTHMEVLANLIEDDIVWIDEIINNQFIAPLVQVNYPDLDEALYPVYKTELPKHIDVQQTALGLTQAMRLAPIPLSYVYKSLNIPEPKDDEPTIGGQGNNLLDEIINS